MSNIYKIVVLGGGSVGKSALTIQFIQYHFITEYDPTIEDSYRKQFVVDGETYLLDILDTAGQDEFTAMRDHNMRSGDGFLCVFSITSHSSFDYLIEIIKRLYQVTDQPILPIIIVGNKLDLFADRQVSANEGNRLALLHQSKYIETSARTRTNVDEVYSELVRIISDRQPQKQRTRS